MSRISRHKPHIAEITSHRAQGAWYLDFEGNIDTAPSLLGVLTPESLEQIVLEPVLAPLANPTAARPTRFSDVDTALHQLRRRVEAEVARTGAMPWLVAFTEHEKNVITAHVADLELATWWADRLVNARPIARRWVNSGRAPKRAGLTHDRSLSCYLRLIDYRVPTVQQRGCVGGTLRRLRSRMTRTDPSRRRLTTGDRRAWTNLLAHNAHDLIGLREVMLAAAVDPRPADHAA